MRRVLALACALAATGCGPASPPGAADPPAPSPTRTYRVNEEWAAAPSWQARVTETRCGLAGEIRPGTTRGPDVEDLCVVAVAFTNVGATAQTFSGTAADAGPTWRIVGYDGTGREFHGRGSLEPPTGPGASGTAELVFDVPAGLRLHEVLIGDALIALG